MSDLIDRQAAIDAMAELQGRASSKGELTGISKAWKCIKQLPSAQPKPSAITDEQAILHLQSTGWMQNHDREMYENGLKKRLADDSGDYDSLIPCEDTISRQQTITALRALSDEDGYINVPHEVVTDVVRGLPPVQAEHEQTTQPERGESDKLWVKTGETYKDTISRQALCEYVLNQKDKSVTPNDIMRFPSAQPVLTCDGCRHVGTYDTDFPCNGCVRKEKDYYDPER